MNLGFGLCFLSRTLTLACSMRQAYRIRCTLPRSPNGRRYAVTSGLSPVLKMNSSSSSVGSSSFFSFFLVFTSSISHKNLSTVCVSAPQKLCFVFSSTSSSFLDCRAYYDCMTSFLICVNSFMMAALSIDPTAFSFLTSSWKETRLFKVLFALP